MNIALVGIALASGFVSALLMLVVGSGAVLGLVLFLFAPLPILLAGLGWGHRTAAIAALAGTLVLGLAAGFEGVRGYILAVGLPGWSLSFLALRERRRRIDPAVVEWLSTGLLVLACAALGALLVLATIPFIGLTLTAYRAALSHGFAGFLRHETGTAPDAAPLLAGTGVDVKSLIQFFAVILPPFGAASWTLVLLLNLWLAARIARASGRLARPWPRLSTLALPGYVLPVLAAALALSFAPGLAGVAGQVVMATLFTTFVLVGLAVVHAGTQGFTGRFFVLLGVYVMLVIQVWTALLLAILGVVEQIVGLRRRLAPPPRPPRRT